MNKFLSSSPFKPAVILLFVTLQVLSCKHEVIVAPEPRLQPCSTDSVYFVNEVFPLIISGCTQVGCHNSDVNTQGSVPLTSYDEIMTEVVAGNAASSQLYKRITATNSTRMPQRPLRELTSDQKLLIQKWINQGALKSDCYSCNDQHYAFNADIKPLIANKCYGCHNDITANGGYDLSVYDSVKVVALNGKLVGSTTWAPNYLAMPRGSGKLPSCQLTQIKKWVEAGAPNN